MPKPVKMSLASFMAEGSWADDVQEQLPSAPASSFSSSVVFPSSPPYNAYIGNLSYETTQEDISSLFSTLNILSIRIIKDKDGKPKGFGYLEFSDLDSLKKSIAFNGSSLKGRRLKIDVTEAKPTINHRENNQRDFSRKQPLPEEKSMLNDNWRSRDKPIQNTQNSTQNSTQSYSKPNISTKPKPNPFGNATPRDEDAILKRIEEKRNQEYNNSTKPAVSSKPVSKCDVEKSWRRVNDVSNASKPESVASNAKPESRSTLKTNVGNNAYALLDNE